MGLTQEELQAQAASDEAWEIKRRTASLIDQMHQLARQKGWHDKELFMDREVLVKLTLIGSEVYEAIKVDRDGGPIEELLEELADIYIRLMDLVGMLCDSQGIAAEQFMQIVLDKHAKNKNRPYRHGGKRY